MTKHEITPEDTTKIFNNFLETIDTEIAFSSGMSSKKLILRHLPKAGSSSLILFHENKEGERWIYSFKSLELAIEKYNELN